MKKKKKKKIGKEANEKNKEINEEKRNAGEGRSLRAVRIESAVSV